MNSKANSGMGEAMTAEGAASMAGLLRVAIEALADLTEASMRQERKLDALIEALAAEGEEEADTIDVTTLDGVHDTRPAADPMGSL